MRTFELRVYTLRAAVFQFYKNTVYPRHLHSFPAFGVEAHGFWTAKDDPAPRFFALISYADGDDPAVVEKHYMASAEFYDDISDFDMADILDVQTTFLSPSPGSPLV